MLRRVTEDYIVNVLKNHDQIVLNCQIELLNICKMYLNSISDLMKNGV